LAGGFKCLVSHAGILDTRIMAYETEELWFTEWENGGVPWEREVNETIERWNPIRSSRIGARRCW
jgi:dipeptidyl aminopeptidase/acylaminoacyl peptidase